MVVPMERWHVVPMKMLYDNAVFIRVEACRRNVDTAAKQTAFLVCLGEFDVAQDLCNASMAAFLLKYA